MQGSLLQKIEFANVVTAIEWSHLLSIKLN